LYAYCGGDPVNYSDPMGTTIQVGNQTLSGNERPIWTNAGEKDVLLAAMIQSNNVYTFKDWNEVHAILGNQQNAEWLVKDLGLTSAQLNTRLLKYKYSNYNMQRISALVNERSSWGTLKVPSSADPGIRQLALIGGTSYQVAELNAVAMASSIPHVSIAVNGLEGIGNGLEGNYGTAALNIGGLLFARTPANEFQEGIRAKWAARSANLNTVEDFLPQANEILAASKARYGDAPGLVAMDRGALEELLRRNGMRITGKIGAGVVRPDRHHIFPQAYRGWFSERGVDIDSYTLELTEGIHGAVHKWLPTGRGWNDEMMYRLGARESEFGSRLTKREILREGHRMRNEFLSGQKVIPYHD